MLHYILQIIAFQLVFLLVYELLLKKETFFIYNRVYLLITPVLAMILPLLKLEFLQQAIPPENMIVLPEIFLGENSSAVTGQESKGSASAAATLNWWLLAYCAGFLFSLGVFFNKFRILKQLFSHKPLVSNHEMKIVEVPQSQIACTFYNTVFLGAQLSEKEREQILSHELVHVRQKHTLDLLFFEILRIVLWFNPLVYIYQNRISTLHEFLADAGVVKNVKKQVYFQQLLNSAFNTEDISFINQFFNHSIIKKRIVMLQKNKSGSVSKFKFLIILPLMLGMLTYASCSSTKGQTPIVASQVAPPPPPPPPAPSATVERVDDTIEDLPIPFAVVEQVPIYPGCENLTTNEERKECISQNINQYVNKNFNTNLGKELGLTGLNRIYVQFKVSESGEVVDVRSRAPHPDLSAEAIRIVNNLPDMQPAMHSGEEVAVLYSLPIVFNIPQPASSEKEKQEGQN
ncbi:M56 family metallopeptidase [Salinimicrobium terrae]|uniref:M56 family metallopeptidase n=1 Tax=Salinimicrobium terrae TaxID=470866 RepID=UPI00041291AD|nr:M56 family metallopeptidase [Salinimicrobium terrae]